MYYFLLMAVGISIGGIFLTMLQTASTEMKLPTGMWKINANGQKGELNIAKVSPDGQITGTVHWLGSEPYTSKIFGFWDKIAWKIIFLKENTAVFDKSREPLSCNTVHPTTKEPCHGRDQVFTGYMFGGLPKDGPMKPFTIAGSFEAFGGTTGTGATADRNVFGWCATYHGDICGSYQETISTMNATTMANTPMTTK
jgi:hypothetical protein